MPKYAVDATYYCNVTGTFELPDGLTFDDLADYHVKWDIFHFVVKGSDEWQEIRLHSASTDSIDWKRPASYEVLSCDEEDEINYDEPLARVE